MLKIEYSLALDMSILLFKVLSITTPFGRSSRVENASKIFESTWYLVQVRVLMVQVLVQCTCTRTSGSGLPIIHRATL